MLKVEDIIGRVECQLRVVNRQGLNTILRLMEEDVEMGNLGYSTKGLPNQMEQKGKENQ